MTGVIPVTTAHDMYTVMTADTVIRISGGMTEAMRVAMITETAAIGIATTVVGRTTAIGGTIAATTATAMSRSSFLRAGNKKARPREATKAGIAPAGAGCEKVSARAGGADLWFI